MSEVSRFVLNEFAKQKKIKFMPGEKELIERIKGRIDKGWPVDQQDTNKLLELYNKKTEIKRLKTANRFYLD